MRTMFDSVNPWAIPISAPMVAGYVDGIYKWTDAGWARFPNAVKVRIAVFASTNDGHVLDIESGNATPAQAPGWVRMRQAAGLTRPTLYVNRANWGAVAAACAGLEVDYWVSTLDGSLSVQVPAGAIRPVAVQYAGSAINHANFDTSQVADSWAAVDGLHGGGGSIITQLEDNMPTLLIGPVPPGIVYSVDAGGKRHIGPLEYQALSAIAGPAHPVSQAALDEIPDSGAQGAQLTAGQMQQVLDSLTAAFEAAVGKLKVTVSSS